MELIGIPNIFLLSVLGIFMPVHFFYSCMGSALNHLSMTRARDLKSARSSSLAALIWLLDRREQALLLCYIGQVCAQVIITIILVILALKIPWWAGLILAFVGAFLIGILSGVSGKIWGQKYPENLGLALAPLMKLFYISLWPFAAVLPVLKRKETITEAQERQYLANDLREIVDEADEDEIAEFDEEDKQIVRSVFELGQTLVREIIVPRTEMVVVDVHAPVETVLEVFSRSGFSRIPVIGEDSDDIRGVVYLKDIVSRIVSRPQLRSRQVHEFMREAFFVPEMMLADDLLHQMRTQAPHLALVFDEWGGTVGLVTFEDLLEELVGEVTDEHDHADQSVEALAEGYRVPARLPLDELGDLFGITIDDDDVDTAGGLLTKALGKVPIVADKAVVHGLELEVESVTGRRKQMSWLIAKLSKVENNSEAE